MKNVLGIKEIYEKKQLMSNEKKSLTGSALKYII